MRDRYPMVAGSSAPVTVQMIDLDSDSGVDALPLTQAHSFEGRAKPLGVPGAAVQVPATLADGVSGRVTLDASALAVGEYAVQVAFTDTAGRRHVYPSDGDGFRLDVREAY